jgi:N-acyl amino acid synthase of PEP-CTERM/exosortase system
MIERAYELRYQVYCLERGFLAALDYPDGRESDDYDEDSAHFYACNRRQELVGYVRLVPPDAQGRLPWQDYCEELISGVRLPAATHGAEISRLMIRSDYRRCRTDAVAKPEAPGRDAVEPGDLRAESHRIMLSLYRQMYRHSLASDIRYWYAAMERPLAKLLQRLDFGFLRIGPETNYFGPVAPYIADLRELEQRLDASQPELLAWMQKPDLEAS